VLLYIVNWILIIPPVLKRVQKYGKVPFEGDFFGEIGGFEGKGVYLESGRDKISF